MEVWDFPVLFFSVPWISLALFFDRACILPRTGYQQVPGHLCDCKNDGPVRCTTTVCVAIDDLNKSTPHQILCSGPAFLRPEPRQHDIIYKFSTFYLGHPRTCNMRSRLDNFLEDPTVWRGEHERQATAQTQSQTPIPALGTFSCFDSTRMARAFSRASCIFATGFMVASFLAPRKYIAYCCTLLYTHYILAESFAAWLRRDGWRLGTGGSLQVRTSGWYRGASRCSKGAQRM